MKKCKTLIAVVLLSALPAVAQTVVKVDGVSYALTSDNTAQIDKNEGCKGDVVIPDSIEYEGKRYLVNTMVNGAFWGSAGQFGIAAGCHHYHQPECVL